MRERSRRCLTAVVASIVTACGSSSKSPEFDPNTIVSVKGRFLTKEGEALASRPIHLRNYRHFAFVDHTRATIEGLTDLFATILLNVAWPFYPIHFDSQQSDTAMRPNYFLDQVKTDGSGGFQFRVRAGNLLRDAEGGINIELVTDKSGDQAKFGRYAFVIKGQDTDLPELKLCDLGGITITEGAESLDFSWQALADAKKYVLNIGKAADRALVWSEALEPDQTTLSLPKTVFPDTDLLVAIEAYSTFEDEKKFSCLTPRQAFKVAAPVTSLAKGKLAVAPGVKFRITSLTNGEFDDGVFFGAFAPASFDLDLEADTQVQTVVLHNLKISTAGELVVKAKASVADTWVEIARAEEKRFMVIDLQAPVTAKTLRIDFSSTLQDLQELSVR